MNGQDAANEAAYEKTIKDPTPLDPAVAAERLKLVKRIFDEQGITFWIGSGTLLGAVREGRFIPWDDEMDTAGVIGMHGLDLDTIYRVGEAFRSHGFYPRIRPNVRHVSVALIKDGIRTDWTCHRIVNGRAYEFPGVELPLHLFETLGEIEFIGERFRTPQPARGVPAPEVRPGMAHPQGAGVRVRRRRRGRGRRAAGPRAEVPAQALPGPAAAPQRHRAGLRPRRRFRGRRRIGRRRPWPLKDRRAGHRTVLRAGLRLLCHDRYIPRAQGAAVRRVPHPRRQLHLPPWPHRDRGGALQGRRPRRGPHQGRHEASLNCPLPPSFL